MRTTIIITALLLSIHGLSAQGAVVPGAYSTKSGGRVYGMPFSYGAYLRHQQLIETSQIAIGSITGMAFRSRTRVLNVRERAWQHLRVQLSHSAKTLATMTTNYAANHGRDIKTVFNAKMDLYKANARAPLEFNCTIPFSTPFLFLRTAPLVVDLYPQNNGYEFNTGCPQGGNGTGMDFAPDPLMRTVAPAKSRTCTNTPPSTMAGGGLTVGGYVLKLFSNGDLMPYGKVCAPGAATTLPTIGSTGGGATLGNSSFEITLAGGNPSGRSAFFLLGMSNRVTSIGSIRLPIDLSPATPVPGCWQSADLLLGFATAMTTGNVRIPAPIPNNNALRGVEVFAQFAVDEPLMQSFVTTQGGLVHVQ